VKKGEFSRTEPFRVVPGVPEAVQWVGSNAGPVELCQEPIVDVSADLSNARIVSIFHYGI
jgi:hypothetical protein